MLSRITAFFVGGRPLLWLLVARDALLFAEGWLISHTGCCFDLLGVLRFLNRYQAGFSLPGSLVYRAFFRMFKILIFVRPVVVHRALFTVMARMVSITLRGAVLVVVIGVIYPATISVVIVAMVVVFGRVVVFIVPLIMVSTIILLSLSRAIVIDLTVALVRCLLLV